jgi:hypothetical protein
MTPPETVRPHLGASRLYDPFSIIVCELRSPVTESNRRPSPYHGQPDHLVASTYLAIYLISPGVSDPEGSGSAWARLAVVTTECPHHGLACHHDDPAQAPQRRHLLRTPPPLPRPATPPALPGPLARRDDHRIHRRQHRVEAVIQPESRASGDGRPVVAAVHSARVAPGVMAGRHRRVRGSRLWSGPGQDPIRGAGGARWQGR